MHSSLATVDLNVAAAGVEVRTLQARSDDDAATATFGCQFAFGRGDLDVAAPGAYVYVTAAGPNVDGAAASLYLDRARNVIGVNAAAAALNLDPSRNASSADISAVGFDFCEFKISGDGDDKFAGKFSIAMAAALPVGEKANRLYVPPPRATSTV